MHINISIPTYETLRRAVRFGEWVCVCSCVGLRIMRFAGISYLYSYPSRQFNKAYRMDGSLPDRKHIFLLCNADLRKKTSKILFRYYRFKITTL